MSPFGNPVVVGYITSPEGEAALERAIAEAQLHDALLVVLHSQRSLGSMEVVDGVEVGSTTDPATSLLQGRGVRFEIREVAESGAVSDDVITVAEEVDASLIVIGLRKRSPVGKLIMGSNAQRILLNATCPVLAVKAP